MDASLIISRKMRFKGKLAMFSIALSFLVMILSVAVSSGFRTEIRRVLADTSGDIIIQPLNMSYDGRAATLGPTPAYLSSLSSFDGVTSVNPVVYKGAIIKNKDLVHGIMFKGIEGCNSDSTSMNVSIPYKLAQMMGLVVGDKMLSYFVDEKVRVRNFIVSDIYESPLEHEDFFIAYADIKDLQRIDGARNDRLSAFEINVSPEYRNREELELLTMDIGHTIMSEIGEDDDTAIPTSLYGRYPQIMDWLDLIDFNVMFIIILMLIVACFNMISALLIILFENISTIGLLKALGMRTKAIARIFFYGAGSIVLKGMLIGNLLAVFICLIQKYTQVLTLNPVNYFLSAVPIDLNFGFLLICDVVAFILIMATLIIPSLFISRVDPAQTMRVS